MNLKQYLKTLSTPMRESFIGAALKQSAGTAAMMQELPLSEAYRLFETGPVALSATAHRGKANAMATLWRMMVEFEPPLAALS
jgi:flavin reductase (DIM6/NTAB) family NADH-FMN oxidoreductase RutF